MDCGLRPPCVPIRTTGVSVVQVLSSIGLLLTTRRSLPLFKLLEWIAVNIMHWNYWISVDCLSNEVLKFVLDFRLLLLQILGLESGLFVR